MTGFKKPFKGRLLSVRKTVEVGRLIGLRYITGIGVTLGICRGLVRCLGGGVVLCRHNRFRFIGLSVNNRLMTDTKGVRKPREGVA